MAKIWNFMKSTDKSKKSNKMDKKMKKKHSVDPDDNMVEEMIASKKKK